MNCTRRKGGRLYVRIFNGHFRHFIDYTFKYHHLEELVLTYTFGGGRHMDIQCIALINSMFPSEAKCDSDLTPAPKFKIDSWPKYEMQNF